MQFLSSLCSTVVTALPRSRSAVLCSTSNLHTSLAVSAWTGSPGPRNWPKRNEVVFPPQKEDEEQRPAFVCHNINNIKYSPKKMWYVACLVRGMSVDEAVKQLNFCHKKGASYVKRAILEAQEKAINEHNVEFKSNLWVAESFNTKGIVIKGLRRHARKRMGEVRYIYTHYYVRLEEGSPPEDYYQKSHPPPDKLLENWIEEMRARKIIGSL